MATRFSLLAACAVGMAVAIAALAAYVTLRSQLHHQLDQSLLKRATSASQTPLVESATLQHYPSDLLGAADVHIFLIYSDGMVRSAVQREASWVTPVTGQELEVARGLRGHTFRDLTAEGMDFRAVTVRAGDDNALMFVQSEQPIENTLDRMGLVLLIVGAGGIVAAAVIGLVVARSALRPVRRLSAAAEHIAATEELRPIEVTGDDELASLATSFNGMLSALQGSRDRQRRLVADAGHELRTPLTSLRTNLELLAQADRQGGMSPQQRAEIVDDVAAQVEELSRLVGDLVELARDEPLARTPEPVDLADVVERAAARAKRRASSVVFD
ncbi:MAG: histidine kinase dimerization/phospho-acceptor domain-containing protein, partial [Nocardioidaceae bacterium]